MPERHRMSRIAIIAFGVDHAELEIQGDHALQQQGDGGRLAAARRSGDEQRPLARIETQLAAIFCKAEYRAPRRKRGRYALQVRLDQQFAKLDDTGPGGGAGHMMHLLLQRGQRVLTATPQPQSSRKA